MSLKTCSKCGGGCYGCLAVVSSSEGDEPVYAEEESEGEGSQSVDPETDSTVIGDSPTA